MNRKQNDNQNQQRSNHNPNSSTAAASSSSSSNDRIRHSQWMNNQNDPDRNSSHDNIMNSVRDRMVNSVAIRGRDATSRRDPLNIEQNRGLCNEIQKTIAAQLPHLNVQNREYLISQLDRVSELAKTTGGCEYLRELLAAEGGGGELIETILEIVAADLPSLMVHEIGAQFVTALFFACDEHQMDTVLKSVLVGNEWEFLDICDNYYGKETVKALIQYLKNEAQIHIVTNVLQNYIVWFTNYEHRQIVLQFFIYTCNNDLSRTRLFNVMGNNCLVIASNELGCRVLQSSICPMFMQNDLIISLIDAVLGNVCVLAYDKYGNYLIQQVIDENIGVTQRIVRGLMGRFCDLARYQFGSNVVKKCLEKCEQRELVMIVVEFTYSYQLPNIAQDYFGHYVLQCALEHIHTPGTMKQFHNLARGINRRVSGLRGFYWEKVIEKINELKNLRAESPFQTPQ